MRTKVYEGRGGSEMAKVWSTWFMDSVSRSSFVIPSGTPPKFMIFYRDFVISETGNSRLNQVAIYITCRISNFYAYLLEYDKKDEPHFGWICKRGVRQFNPKWISEVPSRIHSSIHLPVLLLRISARIRPRRSFGALRL